MNPILRNRLLTAAVGGTIAIAATLIQWHEGMRHEPYKDGGGVLTVCYGHTGQDVVAGKYYTEAECRALLDADLSEAMATVEKQVNVLLSESQKAALASFVYNVGNSAFERSTLLKKLNVGDLSGACDEMRRWKYDEGKVSKGLINRRAIERELCLKPDLLTSPTQ